MEKRKRLPNFIEDGTYHMDVEEYETKKSTYRRKWGYLAAAVLVLVIIYVQCQSGAKRPEAKPTPNHVLTDARVGGNDSTRMDSLKSQLGTPGKRIASALDLLTAAHSADVDTTESSRRLQSASTSNLRGEPEDPISEEDLQVQVDAQIEKVRHMRQVEKVVMETSEEAKKEIVILQDLVRRLIRKQYGTGPLRVEMKLLFPQSMSQPVLPQEQTLVIDLAPITLVPYSVYYFLQMVKYWKGGAFIRNAGHVLQANSRVLLPAKKGLAFQEYHPDFPHKQYTLGYAGRPGGPQFYISTLNNVVNHGPGSQGSKTEADGCFGKLQPQSVEVVKRMQTQPGAKEPMGFVPDPQNHIKIISVKVVTHATS